MLTEIGSCFLAALFSASPTSAVPFGGCENAGGPGLFPGNWRFKAETVVCRGPVEVNISSVASELIDSVAVNCSSIQTTPSITHNITNGVTGTLSVTGSLTLSTSATAEAAILGVAKVGGTTSVTSSLQVGMGGAISSTESVSVTCSWIVPPNNEFVGEMRQETKQFTTTQQISECLKQTVVAAPTNPAAVGDEYYYARVETADVVLAGTVRSGKSCIAVVDACPQPAGGAPVENPTDPGSADDGDDDGVTDSQEGSGGTDAADPDSDGDGVTDAVDPCPVDPDCDQDGAPDIEGQTIGTDPLNADSDGDGWIDSLDLFPTQNPGPSLTLTQSSPSGTVIGGGSSGVEVTISGTLNVAPPILVLRLGAWQYIAKTAGPAFVFNEVIATPGFQEARLFAMSAFGDSDHETLIGAIPFTLILGGNCAPAASLHLRGSVDAGRDDLSARLRPKGPVKNAGVYHVGSGTWTRAGTLKEELGPTFRTIYNNTCSSPLFAAVYPGETWTDEGRLPGVNSPDKLFDQSQESVSAFVGASNECPVGPTSAPGSARGSAFSSYIVDAFTLGYCSDLAGPLSSPGGTGASITVAFRQSSALDAARCAEAPFVAPAPNASFSLMSFPGAGAGPFSCWFVALDLTGASASFSMVADGNGNFSSSPQVTNTELDHCFSWSFSFPGIASPTTTAASGMIVAGVPADVSHLGWATATTIGGGCTAACSAYDGTTWDHQEANAAPVYATNGVVSNANSAEGTLLVTGLGGEAGTGMTTQDSVRVDLNPATSVNGCYFFGGPGGSNPFTSFHLKLHTLAASNVTPVSPGSGFCFGDNCAFTCPCVAPNTVPDPSGGHESGCANSNPLALPGVLGSSLKVTGNSVVSASPATDTVKFTATGQTAGFGFLVKGNAKTPNGVFPATADGIRCASGGLVRFGGHNAGSNGDAAGTWSYPNTAQTTPVSSATAQTAGQNAHYQLFYRNPAAGWCNTFTTNFSNGQILVW